MMYPESFQDLIRFDSALLDVLLESFTFELRDLVLLFVSEQYGLG